MNGRLSTPEGVKEARKEIVERQVNPFPLIERMIELMVPVNLAKDQVRITTQQLSTMQGFHPDKAYIQLLHNHHVRELRSSIDDLKQFSIGRINTLIEQIGNFEVTDIIRFEMDLEHIHHRLLLHRQQWITDLVEEVGGDLLIPNKLYFQYLNGEPTMENYLDVQRRLFSESKIIKEALRTLQRFIERLDGEDVPEEEREFQLPFDI